MNKWHLTSLFLGLIFYFTLHANSPPKKGNFSLPSPQQPGTFLSFGQTLIGQGHMQFNVNTYNVHPLGSDLDNLNFSFIYGLTDETSLYFSFPIESDYSTKTSRLSGLGDIVLQLEHGFYTAENSRYQEEATIVGQTIIPVAPINNVYAPLGYGSMAYFAGLTFNRTYVDWLAYVSPGALLTTPGSLMKVGSEYVYQGGIGRNIISESDRYILLGLIELDGQYTEKDNVHGHALPNTGGNLILLTPSIWFSTPRLIAQAGIGFPLVQHLFGQQEKMDYSIAASLSWTIT